jgi:serine/threonine protein kinase/Tfp pilus assembly protein PilF
MRASEEQGTPTTAEPRQDDPRVIRALEEYLGALADDRRPARSEFLARHADVAGVLARALDGLDFIDRAVPELHRSGAELCAGGAEEVHGETLGDFRIVREVGRGGMGIVYEAVQLSLGRRVALKVLPFAATMDPRQLARFKNEAQAAAGLHHTGIVPVYFVGVERGVHFYAMQFIDGRTLASVIHELRQAARHDARARPVADLTGPYTPPPGAGADQTPAQVALSTERSVRDPAYCRGVAQMGIQAAEALEHAHQLGVFHRDVKPANLMVDGRGHVWITDFGLAHCQSQASLTMTGDLVGTLRYMSPGQALAGRVPLDHRSDVYSLGATLYEMLTLEPAFAGTDRQELLRQVAFEEPRPPRRINRAVPAELETIVLKAMEKNPGERYATAQELADDLRRFLEDRPIRARRPSLLLRSRKWARRHRPLVGATAVVLLALAVMLGTNGVRAALVRAERAGAIEADLERGTKALRGKQLAQAAAALSSAEARLVAGAPAALNRRVEQMKADLDMARTLEAIPLQLACERLQIRKGLNRKMVIVESRPEHLERYHRAFAEYGLDLRALDAATAAERIRASAIEDQLLDALFFWIGLTARGAPEGQRLEAVLVLAEEDELRRELLRTFRAGDWVALERLAERPEVSSQSPRTQVILSQMLWSQAGVPAAAIRLLRKAMRDHPNDPRLNDELGLCLVVLVEPPRCAEAVGYFRAALVAHGGHWRAWLNLAVALHQMGDLPGAEAAYRKAIEGRPDHAPAHNNLGATLVEQGQYAAAAVAYRNALHHDPQLAEAMAGLGVVLCQQGQLARGQALFAKALARDPNQPDAHNNLGNLLFHQGKFAEARSYFEKAIALRPLFPEAHHNLGQILRREGKLAEAVAEYRLAVDAKPDYALAHLSLAMALLEQGKFSEAVDACTRVLLLQPELEQFKTFLVLGEALVRQGKLPVAESVYREFLRHRPNSALGHHQLGQALSMQVKLPEAEAAFRKAGQLDPKYAQAYQNLGAVLLRAKKPAEAEITFCKAIRLEPAVANSHDGLGGALGMQGKFAEAVKAHRQATQLQPRDPRLRYNLRVAERRLALEPRLPALLRGEGPIPASERIAVAELCCARQLFVSAVRLYREAFAALPDLAENPASPLRFNAACVAARAAAGEGAEAGRLGEGDRAGLRGQALTWLQAELTAWRQRLDKEPEQARLAVLMRFAPWEHDPDLAPVREAKALARLAESDRRDWRNLWDGVAALLAKARGEKK